MVNGCHLQRRASGRKRRDGSIQGDMHGDALVSSATGVKWIAG